ncbi:MAG: adenine phosphoribosyltransferase [Candidatus Terrybacteria bacterium RIFCSPLOWO2_01_FULL_58_14]|uniref:Adenine phosphoribosyltransferase n=2 Tax=Candidatus Terryibacteriota TaxID=1817920 RepID=A0A1G2PVM8_9BACT|nr:MAG: adenine phosphoribosyltransferase [Candidatus Terrybacteria bacterium RIFCSPHIGHO2_01_FULL_58_15]OHA52380.1 MAG: adenine phosphoribosyltransferase [Candidatus Terrybacteria bacterium RIFCSPLOWO2_01_FULL_58_14]
MEKDLSYLKTKIRDVRDFPTPGVLFKDIAPVLEDSAMLHDVTDGLAEKFRGGDVVKVLGVDARGFLLAAPVAYLIGAGVVMARKKGKLPSATVKREHGLEYGKGTLEVHRDAISQGERIAIIDDVLATGGTARAAIELVEELGGEIVGLGFLLELTQFSGRALLGRHEIFSLLRY